MDLKVIETGNGGDIVKNSKDLSVVDGFENMIYLGMFGGNVAGTTPETRIESEQAVDFWGNNLLWPDDGSVQFNSLTEKQLMDVALSSSGRAQIEQGVKSDLDFLKDIAEVTVEVTIPTNDRLEIYIKVVKLDNLQEKEFIYIWDATISELSEQ